MVRKKDRIDKRVSVSTGQWDKSFMRHLASRTAEGENRTDMFWVWSYNPAGKEKVLDEWLKKTLRSNLGALEGVESVTTYKRRFGLGQRPVYQTWIKIGGFPFFNAWGDCIDSKKWREIFDTFFDIVRDFNTTIVTALE